MKVWALAVTAALCCIATQGSGLQFSTRYARSSSDFDEVAALKASGRFLTAFLVKAVASEEYSEEARAETKRKLREMLCGANERGEEAALVACRDDDGRVIGTCDVAVLDASGSDLPRRAHIKNLIVEEGSRRRGVATALVRQALAEGTERGVSCVSLEVESDNDAARTLYSSLGFQGESIQTPLAFLKYGTVGWNKHLLRLDLPSESAAEAPVPA